MGYQGFALQELIDQLKELMARHGLREAYVFGSRVRGDHLHRSDLDVIVVDERYAGTPFTQRGLDVLRDWPYTIPELELFCYTPEEFARGNIPIRAALREGIHVVLDEPVAVPSPTTS